ncbi:MAG: hypothetical protein E7030_08600 [Akkermansiaceae bacterium]|nr:hypothetical protein [Akkermansiaceae bacterium]
MSTISPIAQFGNVPVNTAVLRDALHTYRAPQAKIKQLEQRGELIPLRRNLYLCKQNTPCSRQLIANHLLTPSYISYESVLGNAGIIPERVYTIRSSCTGRSRRFENATGTYDYVQVPLSYYPIGITIGHTAEGYGYYTARPEKALCDLILATSGLRLQSPKSAGEYLEIYLRADMDALRTWNTNLLHTIALAAHKKKADLLNLEKFIRHECL